MLSSQDRQSIGLRKSQEAFRIYGLGVLPNFPSKETHYEVLVKFLEKCLFTSILVKINKLNNYIYFFTYAKKGFYEVYRGVNIWHAFS